MHGVGDLSRLLDALDMKADIADVCHTAWPPFGRIARLRSMLPHRTGFNGFTSDRSDDSFRYSNGVLQSIRR